MKEKMDSLLRIARSQMEKKRAAIAKKDAKRAKAEADAAAEEERRRLQAEADEIERLAAEEAERPRREAIEGLSQRGVAVFQAQREIQFERDQKFKEDEAKRKADAHLKNILGRTKNSGGKFAQEPKPKGW